MTRVRRADDWVDDLRGGRVRPTHIIHTVCQWVDGKSATTVFRI
jgi:hypothetical protein